MAIQGRGLLTSRLNSRVLLGRLMVCRGYVRSLLLSLVKPPAEVTRLEIWKLLAKALAFAPDELISCGVPMSPDEKPSVHQVAIGSRVLE